MATMLKTIISNNVQNTIAICYIDSINKSSYMNEMFNHTIKYIRENTTPTDQPIDRSGRMALNYQDIQYNRKDGYWIVGDDVNNKVTLYRRYTSIGNLYNSVCVDLIHILTFNECPRIVPKILKTTALFDNFTDELKLSVTNFKNRRTGIE